MGTASDGALDLVAGYIVVTLVLLLICVKEKARLINNSKYMAI